MAKRNKKYKATPLIKTEISNQKQTDIGRGTINHSAIAALVTSKVFSIRVEKAKKGKGAFTRKAKHTGKEYYQIAA
jgi:alternative ribosome-rescue factor